MSTGREVKGQPILLLDHLTSVTLTNNLSNVSLQVRPIESMSTASISCSDCRPLACNSQKKKSRRGEYIAYGIRNLNRYPSCNRNSSISRVGPSRNMIYISPKSENDSYSSLNHSNLVTYALIATNIITRRLSTSATLFSTPALCLRTNV